MAPVARRGELLADGRTSRVYAYGSDSVVKVPRPDVPAHWSAIEARLTSIMNDVGVPSPSVRGTTRIDGRESIIFERITGPSMWQEIVAQPSQVRSYACELARIQGEIAEMPPVEGVPDLVVRMMKKISEASQLDDCQRATAICLVQSLPRGAALLHGDLHPGNVLMSPTGPVVIDWFDAAIGRPVADVVRTSWLVRPLRSGAQHEYLPGGQNSLLCEFHACYRSHVDHILDGAADDVSTWETVVAVSRLSEGIASEEADLLGIWNDRSRCPTSRR